MNEVSKNLETQKYKSQLKPAKQVTLDFCHGSTGGTALYLNCQDAPGIATGHRVAGPKCWGLIQTRHSFKLTREDLQEIVEEAQKAIKFLGKA